MTKTKILRKLDKGYQIFSIKNEGTDPFKPTWRRKMAVQNVLDNWIIALSSLVIQVIS